ncbi:efflux RND transporter periplasmic adaptor subunit [Marinifilum caeruleilacunae]|uniref:Efflux RND transporter periplasmic adaptor subunit n=1 Tax=Marinifilum caeruleilacunae TaxID=2499076 RepID=A0ABX1WTR8_9BACT|nr:efflux RND transporter periplasmic adaptor subunit [Marinifilum caeruleilacunae]NOU59407.1 efflux RND transporter periplasmic adaptor subunit [Marinifilum caeruleilacunae]
MKMMKTTKILILLMVITAGLFSCKDKNEKKVELVQPVKIFKVNASGNQQTKVFTGLVKESREVRMAFQVPGPLVKLNVDQGQFVKKGEVIAELDKRDFKVNLESANANYENAKLQAERYAALYQKKSTSKSVYDQTQAAFKLARAQKEAAENALEDTKIYAPFTGYIQSMFVENFEKIGAGQPIVSILDLNNLEVTVALSENDFLMRNTFESFTCSFENFKNTNFNLSLIDIERKPNGDNFFKMRLQLDANKQQVVPGMVASVSVSLKSEGTKSYKVPVESVFSNKGKSYVWIFDNNKQCVKQREVKMLGFDSKGMVNLADGISNGEIIVAAGVHSLREGQKVKMLVKKSNTNVGGQL